MCSYVGHGSETSAAIDFSTPPHPMALDRALVDRIIDYYCDKPPSRTTPNGAKYDIDSDAPAVIRARSRRTSQ